MLNRQKELVKYLTDQQLMTSFYLSQGMLFALAIILGWVIFGNLTFLFQLFDFTDTRVWIVGGTAGLTIFFIDVFLMKRLPEAFYDDGGINDRIFTNRGFFRIIWIALLVAFCEELLFRGVFQTKFGLIIASIIFAVVHIRYLANWFLFLNTVIISFLIGWIFEWTGNLAVTFFMHFIIDCSLGLYFNYVKNSSKNKPIHSAD